MVTFDVGTWFMVYDIHSKFWSCKF